jgi:hypothetical protein
MNMSGGNDTSATKYRIMKLCVVISLRIICIFRYDVFVDSKGTMWQSREILARGVTAVSN